VGKGKNWKRRLGGGGSENDEQTIGPNDIKQTVAQKRGGGGGKLRICGKIFKGWKKSKAWDALTEKGASPIKTQSWKKKENLLNKKKKRFCHTKKRS